MGLDPAQFIIAEYGLTGKEGCLSSSWSAEQEEWTFPRPRSRLMIWSREKGSAVLFRVSLLILPTQAESAAYSPLHTNSGCGKERRISILVNGDLPRQHSFGTTLRFTGPVPVDSRQ